MRSFFRSIARTASKMPISPRYDRWHFTLVSRSRTRACTNANARAARRPSRSSEWCAFCATRSTSTKCCWSSSLPFRTNCPSIALPTPSKAMRSCAVPCAFASRAALNRRFPSNVRCSNRFSRLTNRPTRRCCRESRAMRFSTDAAALSCRCASKVRSGAVSSCAPPTRRSNGRQKNARRFSARSARISKSRLPTRTHTNANCAADRSVKRSRKQRARSLV